MTDAPITAILLAGSRPGVDPLAERAGVAAKALVPIGGQPMIDRPLRALLAQLVREAARALGVEYNVEVVEMHHRMKVDAPSGTALMLGAAAAEGRGVALDEMSERGRDGNTGARKPGAIGFASLRGGDVVGEHQVVFAGPGERLTLGHIATDRMLFARGAARAALWGQGREPGEYDMLDVLGLRDG